MTHQTLVDLIEGRADVLPSRLAYRFLVDGESREQTMSYADLRQRARAIAAVLASRADVGDRALLIMPPGLDYIAAFMGCLFAGLIAVPAYPPDPTRLARTLPRLSAIARDAGARVVLTTTDVAVFSPHLGPLGEDLAKLPWVTCDDVPRAAADDWRRPAVRADDTAFLQYSSGSTGEPKGVILSHANLLTNSELIKRAFRHSDDLHMVSWLPPYHDMGLIGGILQSAYVGGSATLMSPMAFLEKPLRWLRAIARFGGTTSGGPNFAFDLCVRKVRPEERDALDLRSWRLAFNGAEPIRKETHRRFAEYFAPSGLRASALFPCYGLAESTLFVCGRNADPRADDEVGGEGPFDCGPVWGDTSVVIVEPENRRRLPAGEVGELWIRGGSVGKGYWKKAELSTAIFDAHLEDGEGPYLRTGDLGFEKNGHISIAGRLKDLIIVRGRNVYPQDLERTASESHPSLRAGCTAAFAIDRADGEGVVLAQEVDGRHLPIDVEGVAASIRERIASEHDVQVHAVLLLRAGSIPKTSSGKIQRFACKEGFSRGDLDLVGQSVVADPMRSSSAFLDATSLWATPASDREVRLRDHVQAVVAEILRLDVTELDPIARLVSYGLDSMAGIEVVSSLEEAFDVTIPLARLFEGATVSSLVKAILEAGPGTTRAPLAHGPPREGDISLSHGQRALWFLHQLAPESPVYNVAAAVRLRSVVEPDALQRALETVAERHPALTTAYDVDDAGRLSQTTRAAAPVPLKTVDATGWDESQLERAVATSAQQPFELRGGALARLTRFRGAAGGDVLLFCAHHSVVDLWSVAIVLQELGESYGHSAPTFAAPAPRHTYRDFVQWQQDWLESAAGERAWSFWKGELCGDLPRLELPRDRPRQPSPRYRGGARRFAVGRELSQRLSLLARAHGTTLFTTLLAAYEVLLGRIANEEEVLVGSPVHGRSRSEFRDVVGYFVNTVVLRGNLRGNPTFAQLLADTRAHVNGAIEHQDYPFSMLVERLETKRERSRSPLFSTMFVLEKAPRSADLGGLVMGLPETKARLGSLEVEGFPVALDAAEFDLTASVVETPDGIHGTFHYDADLFDASTVEQWVHWFEGLLDALASAPERRVWDVPLEGSGGPNSLQSPVTRRARVEERPIHATFAAQARQTPDSLAVRSGACILSYAELDAWSERVARRLSQQGIRAGDAIGLCLGRGVEWVVGMLGIFKAGGVLVPLVPEMPAARLAFIARDASVRAVVTDTSHDRLTQPWGVARLDVAGAEDEAHRSAEIPVDASPGDRAYVIYTSGSTGTPKGVVVSHAAIAGHIEAMADYLTLSPSDRVLQFGSFSFDAALEQILAPLTRGAAVVLRGEEIWDSTEFWRHVADEEVSVADVPTAYWHGLLSQAAIDFRKTPRLRAVIVGGEAMKPAAVEKWLALEHRPLLFNAYGPTEATITTSLFPVTERAVAAYGSVPIGHPLPNKPVWVVDRHGHACPVGVPGELCIGGPHLATEYLNLPELTREHFVVCPFSDDPDARMYRSGDRAMWRCDGTLEFLGREDGQIKVRGFRVELGEIERALEEHPDVRSAVVIAHEVRGHTRLAAYVVPVPGSDLARFTNGSSARSTATTLRGFLAERLPDVMIPSTVVGLTALPSTVAGKIDRAALPIPEVEEATGGARAETGVERLVAAAWADAFGATAVAADANFFELGGHSLLATELTHRLRQTFRFEFPLHRLLEAPTVAGWARVISAHEPSPGRAEALVRALSKIQAMSPSEIREALQKRANSKDAP
jgi:amino acid adenylation domain-containing protein